MTYKATEEALEIAQTLRLFDATIIEYLTGKLEIAYTQGQIAHNAEMAKHLGES